MRTYDISVTISPDLPVWPGDPRVEMKRIGKMEDGDPSNVTHLSLSAHVGTHVDAPFHFLGGSAPTVESLPLSLLTGRAYVLHLSDDVDLITAAVLERAEIPPRTRRLLFRTRNSHFWKNGEGDFQTGFVGLSDDGARYIVSHGVRLVGIDYLSIAPFTAPTPTHQTLLGAGVVIVEGLNLGEVSQGRYTLYCLPLKLAGCDGAPARAILVGV
ncbi:MAG: cyclase family protein [Chloroflexota bacterium]